MNRKIIPENENPEKIVSFVEKNLNFNNQQKGKGRSHMLASSRSNLARVAKVSDYSNIQILHPKQTLQRLAIALTQVKAGNTSENLLNEIRQIIYSLYRWLEKSYILCIQKKKLLRKYTTI